MTRFTCPKHNVLSVTRVDGGAYCPECHKEACVQRVAARYATEPRTHCAQGHELTPDNQYMRPGLKQAQCRTCRKAKARERYARSQTRCQRGHEFTPENTTWAATAKRQQRRCKTCIRESAPTTCPNGHQRTPENLEPDDRGNQRCRLCHAARRARYTAAMRKTRQRNLPTHCSNGHEFNEQNTIHAVRLGHPVRKCQACLTAQGLARRTGEHGMAISKDDWFDWVVPLRVASGTPIGRQPTLPEFKVIMEQSTRLTAQELYERTGVSRDRIRQWRHRHPETQYAGAPETMVYAGAR